MRVVAGRHRGRRLTAPAGLTVRPTSERAREALFDILAHGRFGAAPVFLNARVLDVFAGTGAFGLEALSRGARFAAFIEQDRAARDALGANIARLGEERRSRIIAADGTRPPKSDGPHELIFLDPPYGGDLAVSALAALARTGWFAPAALVVIEQAARASLLPPAGFELLEERRYGAARFAFLRAPR